MAEGLRRNKLLDADVIVIGGGPTGIYISSLLRKKKLKVLVIEKDRMVGVPRFCSGLISKEAYERFDLPKSLVQNTLHSAWIFSPGGDRFYLKDAKSEVFVVNRTAFDQSLYKKARSEGVEFLLHHFCSDLRISRDFIEAEIVSQARQKVIRKKAVACIIATGVNYQLHRKLDMGIPPDFLDCSQMELPYRGFSEIEIYLGNKVAPHSFAWIIPVNSRYVRVGVSTKANSDKYLMEFINNSFIKNSISARDVTSKNIIRRPIPLGLTNKTYGDRVLVIGDAGSQVKPTTGGGLYFGLLCTEIAADVIKEAFDADRFDARFLSRYEKRWKKDIGFDLEMGFKLRKLMAAVKDKQIDLFIKFLNREEISRLIEKHANFDHHGRIIKELIKRPSFWNIIYKLLSNGAHVKNT